jgi:hypothetical protein
MTRSFSTLVVASNRGEHFKTARINSEKLMISFEWGEERLIAM